MLINDNKSITWWRRKKPHSIPDEIKMPKKKNTELHDEKITCDQQWPQGLDQPFKY